MKLTIFSYVVAGLATVVLAASVPYTVLLARQKRADLVAVADANLLAAAESAAEILGPDFHDRLFDHRSVTADDYVRVVDSYGRLCRRLGLQYIWSVLQIDDQIVFTSATRMDLDNRESKHATFFEPHNDPGAFRIALDEPHGPSFSTYKNEWGTGRMVLVPKHDRHGRVYILGASKQLKKIENDVRATTLAAIKVGVLIFAGALLLSLVLGRVLTAPVVSLTHRVKELADGHLGKPIKTFRIKELQVLNNAMNQMRLELEDRIMALRQSEHNLAITLKSIGDAVIATDADGRVTRMNPVAEHLTGWTFTDAENKPLAEVFRIINSESREPASDPVARVLSTGQVVGLANHTALITRDGTEYQIADSAAPIMDTKDHIVGVVLVFHDVTEQYSLQESLRENEKHMRQLFESMITGFALHEIICNEDGCPCDYRFLQINPAFGKLTGLTADKIIGRTVLEVLPKTEPVWIETYGRVVMTGNSVNLEQYSQELGRHYQVTAYRPKPGHFATLITDVTEQKLVAQQHIELQRRMQQTQKLESLGVLAGGIAHDFNNILMIILGNAELAMEEISPMSPARTTLQHIATAARRAGEMCRQLLAYSGKASFALERVDLRELIDEMAHLLKTSISKKAVLNLRTERNLPVIIADASQIRQIVLNLILNASGAIGDRSGVITISVGSTYCDKGYLHKTELHDELTPGHYVHLEVVDTGCGMSEETRQRLFEPFYTTKFTGRGLGLAAVLGIVRAHRGGIKVYSELTRGTTFKILFPAVDQEVGGASVEKLPADRVEWKGTGTVLVADDEETLRALGARMLERLGFDVLVAADGREAVNCYRDNADRIKLVLLDLTMPHMDGAQAFTELRRMRPDVPVILVSGYSEEDVSSRFAGKGVSGVMQKPYSLGKLRGLLSIILDDAKIT